MKRTILILALLIPMLSTQAQRWKQYRYDLFFGLGTTNFMGDLGGGGADASHFLGVRDLDGAATRPSFHAGMRYKIFENMTVRGQIFYGFLNGSDERSGSYGRQNRNLSFYSPLMEASSQIEYHFIKEKISSRYQISAGLRNLLSAYVFVGVGGFYFNPKALGPDGNWYELQPLGTEGQGHVTQYKDKDSVLVKVPNPYKRFQLAIPMGIGAKYTINRYWSIGMELSNRYTTTDYIDDVSNRYFNFYEAVDKGWISGTYENYAVHSVFSDRHIHITDYNTNTTIEPGDPDWEENRYESGKRFRGSPDYNDSYMMLNITLYRKLSSTRSGLPKFK